jgi:hypothetical protein
MSVERAGEDIEAVCLLVRAVSSKGRISSKGGISEGAVYQEGPLYQKGPFDRRIRRLTGIRHDDRARKMSPLVDDIRDGNNAGKRKEPFRYSL